MKTLIDRTEFFMINLNRSVVPSYNEFYQVFMGSESSPNSILLKLIGLILDKTGFLLSIKNIQKSVEFQGKTSSNIKVKIEIRNFLNLIFDILRSVSSDLKPFDIELFIEIVRNKTWSQSKSHSTTLTNPQKNNDKIGAFQRLLLMNSISIKELKKKKRIRKPIEIKFDQNYKFKNWLEAKLAMNNVGLQMHVSEIFTISAIQSVENYSIDSSVEFTQEKILQVLKEYKLKSKMRRCYKIAIVETARLALFIAVLVYVFSYVDDYFVQNDNWKTLLGLSSKLTIFFFFYQLIHHNGFGFHQCQVTMKAVPILQN